MAASKQARQECGFEIGDVIEHRSFVVGYRGAWFRSKVSLNRLDGADRLEETENLATCTRVTCVPVWPCSACAKMQKAHQLNRSS